MMKKAPRSGSTMASFHAKALEKGKGKGSLETVMTGNPSAVEAFGPSTADGRRRRRRKESSNIAIVRIYGLKREGGGGELF